MERKGRGSEAIDRGAHGSHDNKGLLGKSHNHISSPPRKHGLLFHESLPYYPSAKIVSGVIQGPPRVTGGNAR